jgi:hypothetical protein
VRERFAGERASFRACLGWLAEQFVPHYDDLIAFHTHSGVRDMIAEQLRADCASARPSLLAKSKGQLTRTLAHAWRTRPSPRTRL